MLETAIRLSTYLITVQVITMNPLFINKRQTKESCFLSTGKISCQTKTAFSEKKKKMLSVENSDTNALQKIKQLRAATHLLKATRFFPKSFHPLTTNPAGCCSWLDPAPAHRHSGCRHAFQPRFQQTARAGSIGYI